MTLTANNLEMTTRSDCEISQDDVNLKRVIYILQYGDLEENARYLVGYMQKVRHRPRSWLHMYYKPQQYNIFHSACAHSYMYRSGVGTYDVHVYVSE